MVAEEKQAGSSTKWFWMCIESTVPFVPTMRECAKNLWSLAVANTRPSKQQHAQGYWQCWTSLEGQGDLSSNHVSMYDKILIVSREIICIFRPSIYITNLEKNMGPVDSSEVKSICCPCWNPCSVSALHSSSLPCVTQVPGDLIWSPLLFSGENRHAWRCTHMYVGSHRYKNKF